MAGYTLSALRAEIKAAEKSVRATYKGHRVYFDDAKVCPTDKGYLRLAVYFKVANGHGGFIEDCQRYHTVAL